MMLTIRPENNHSELQSWMMIEFDDMELAKAIQGGVPTKVSLGTELIIDVHGVAKMDAIPGVSALFKIVLLEDEKYHKMNIYVRTISSNALSEEIRIFPVLLSEAEILNESHLLLHPKKAYVYMQKFFDEYCE